MLQAPTECIFCGGEELTDEHVLPLWAGKVLQRLGDGEWTYLRFIDRRPVPAAFATKSARAATSKIRCVCKTCNGGWMSRLEVDAKAILTPLILGEPRKLSVDDRVAAATWLTKTALVHDLLGDRPAILPDARRTEFGDRKTPFSNSDLYVGRYEGRRTFARYAVPATDSGTGERCLLFTTLMGSLFLQVAIRNDERGDVIGRSPIEGLAALWPAAYGLMWPPRVPLTDSDLEEVACLGRSLEFAENLARGNPFQIRELTDEARRKIRERDPEGLRHFSLGDDRDP